jgi:hypothetical protein
MTLGGRVYTLAEQLEEPGDLGEKRPVRKLALQSLKRHPHRWLVVCARLPRKEPRLSLFQLSNQTPQSVHAPRPLDNTHSVFQPIVDAGRPTARLPQTGNSQHMLPTDRTVLAVSYIGRL